MRLAIPGSVLAHLGGAALAVMLLPAATPDMPNIASVSVDLIATHDFSNNASVQLDSDTLVDAKASGGEPVSTPETETIAPIGAEGTPMLAAQEPAGTSTQDTPTTELASSESAATGVVERLETAALSPSVSATLTASMEEIVHTAPVPYPRPMNRPERRPEEYKKIAKRPPAQAAKAAPRRAEPEKQANSAGNGGNSSTNSRASKASSNSRAVTNYPGQIVSKLRRALRYPSGTRKSGEAHVQFVVAANGRASSVRLVRSSGDARLDAAAVATVKRAAPFPAIPPAANRSAWTFTVPLKFQR